MLSKTNELVCPVTALLPYLAVRGSNEGPLFMMANQQYLTPSLFRASLFNTLKSVGINTHEYNTHSFRIGAATSAKAAGISDLHIKCWVDGKVMLTKLTCAGFSLWLPS